VTPDVPLAAACVAVAACAFRVAAPDRPESRLWRWLLLLAGAAAMFLKMPVGVVCASLPLLVPFALPAGERAAARSRLRTYRLALAGTIAVLVAIVAVRAAMGASPLGFGLHEFERKVAVLRNPENAPSALAQNVERASEFAWLYFGPVGTVLLLVGLVGAWVARHRAVMLLSAFALAWTAVFVANARNLSAHYLLAVVPFYVMTMAWVVVAVARALQRRGERPIVTGAVAGGVVALVLATAWPLHRALWTDPTTARFAGPERTQYVEGKWSGYGLPEAAAWLDQAAARGGAVPLFVAIHIADYQRLRLYAGEAARENLEQIQVERYTVRVPQMIERAQALQESGRRVLLVVGSDTRFEKRWRSAFPDALRRAGFEKPGGESSAVVIELMPDAASGSRGIFGR
jgi:hypothetical protein